MKARVNYKLLKEGVYVSTKPLLYNKKLVDVMIYHDHFTITKHNKPDQVLAGECCNPGHREVKIAAKKWLKLNDVPFADEVRKRDRKKNKVDTETKS